MFAVTVPAIRGREPMVTLLEMLAVTLPICAVPATKAEREPMVTLFPTVTEPEMGRGLTELTSSY